MSHTPIFKQTATWLAVTGLAIGLVACGGGGGSTAGSPNPTVAGVSGVAVDGYLQGATAYLDLNSNGTLDAGEPSTTTDAQGRYIIPYSGDTTGLKVVVSGGVDTDTGFAFTGKLTARVSSDGQGQVVTPLTTLLDTMVSEGVAADLAAAKTLLASKLGMTTDQFDADPVAALASQPGIYTNAVTLQRTVQMLASANQSSTESAHEAQEKVIKTLARAIRTQSSTVDVATLVASVNLTNATQAQALANSLNQAVRTSLREGGHSKAKDTLKAMDEIRKRMEDDDDYDIYRTAKKVDDDHGYSGTQPYTSLVNTGTTSSVLVSTVTTTVVSQPANTSGRLLASNCFQCHGTGGMGGFDRIRGDAREVKEYLTKSASSDIMAAHAQGYTSAQLDAIIAYLQQ